MIKASYLDREAMSGMLADSFLRGFKPHPVRNVSDWADQCRIVGRPSPEPGMWDTARVPYARDIMDALTPTSKAEIVVLKKAAQGAGTEIGLNAIGCWMDDYPTSIIVVTPTTGTLKKFSRTRIDRLIENCPSLRGLVKAPKSRDGQNTIQFKEFGADHLILTGANSAAGLRSDPCERAFCDEIDAYPLDIDGEGAPVDLLIQRTASFRGRKIFLVSTPTVEEFSAVSTWYEKGDQNRFHVPCPACDKMQELIFGDERVKEDRPGGLRWKWGDPDSAEYECEFCRERFPEHIKNRILPRGEHIPDNPGHGRGIIKSFHVNALVYPHGWPGNSWSNLAAEWENCHKDPIRRKTFVNLKKGLAYRDPAEAKASVDVLMGRREQYGPEVPAGVGYLTAGVDVQGDRFEVEVVGWGEDEESWSIEYRAILCDTSKLESYEKELLPYLKSSEFLSEMGVPLRIESTCIDSGYQSDTVLEFCDMHRFDNIWPVKGMAGFGRPFWPPKRGKMTGRYRPPFILGVDSGKESIYARLKLAEPGPGFCHFPMDRDTRYFEMLLSEVRVPDYTKSIPTFAWKKKREGEPNEGLDNRNYAFAALRAMMHLKAFRLNATVNRFKAKCEDNAGRPQRVVAAGADLEPVKAELVEKKKKTWGLNQVVSRPDDPYLD